MDDRNLHNARRRPRGAYAASALAALALLALAAGCGRQEPQVAYKLLGVQDFSHGRVGRFSARVSISSEMPREMVRLVIRDVVAKVVEENRADVCWVLVHSDEPPTIDNLLASAQWVSPSLPKEDRPYIEVSDDATPYAGAPIYVIWP